MAPAKNKNKQTKFPVVSVHSSHVERTGYIEMDAYNFPSGEDKAYNAEG